MTFFPISNNNKEPLICSYVSESPSWKRHHDQMSPHSPYAMWLDPPTDVLP